ncbi:MAG: M64 family metallopeptidase [Candidatus Cryptobacteroides sp.]
MNIRIAAAAVAAIISLVTVSCTPDHTLSVNPLSIEFPKAGKSLKVTVSSNVAWEVTCPEWITCSPSSGTGNAEVTVTAAQNAELDRSATLMFTGSGLTATVEVFQTGVDFSLSSFEFAFDEAGAPQTMTVYSKYDWDIDNKEVPWCLVSPSSGAAGETVVTLTPAKFTDRTPRNTAFLQVNFNGSFRFVTVSQTMPNSSPEKAVLTSPGAGETNVSTNVTFKWNAPADPDGDVLTYNLMISSNGGQTWQTTESTTNSTKFSSYLEKNTEYMWKVEAMDPFGGKSMSDARSFTTGTAGGYVDGEVRLVKAECAGAPQPVHLIFTGDGFIEEDYHDGGAFDQAVETAVNAFFSVEPYATYKDYFRVSVVAAYSEERGATVQSDMSGCKAQKKNTKFSSTLDGGNSTGISCDYDRVFDYARKVEGVSDADLNNTTVFVIINLNVYAGTCMMMSVGRSVSMCPTGSSFGKVVTHEGGGHGFGRLLDEYRYYNESLPPDRQSLVNSWRAADPYFGYNISLTGDRDLVHWKHYFDMAGYDAVGMFEGAYLYNMGAWRPEYISCMEDNRPYYNAPSREAIVRRIMKASGSNFDFNDFIAKDAKALSSGAVIAAKAPVVPYDFVPLAPPIMIDNR